MKLWTEAIKARQKVSTMDLSADKTSRMLQMPLPSEKRRALPALADSNILGRGFSPGATDSSTSGPATIPSMPQVSLVGSPFLPYFPEYQVTQVKYDIMLQCGEFKSKGKDRSWVLGDPSFNKL